MTDTLTQEIYTSIEDLPLDFYEEGSDHDDSIHKDRDGAVEDLIPRTLELAAKPLVKYVPYTRTIRQGYIGRDCLAVKRALSVAGFGKWGG